jgi:glycosyltransferase involved in cell wall biosynthesis
MPQISVVIPAFNSAATIRATIASVLNQTFTDWELIIIDDGSQDATLAIAQSFLDTRIQVFSYPNAGSSASRNRGIGHAAGQYVAFLDADDLWTPDKLEAQFQALQANPDAAVAYSWTHSIDESDHFLRRGSYLSANGHVYAKLLLVDFIESGSNPLILKQALLETGGFDVSLRFVEDWDMWLRLAKHYQFVCVPSPQVQYRISRTSMSSNVRSMASASLQIIEQAFVQSAESVQHLKEASIANRHKYLTFLALQKAVCRRDAVIAIECLMAAIKSDLRLLKTGVLIKVLFKITLMALLSPRQAELVLAKFKKLSNTDTLFGYLQLETSKLKA